MSGNTAPGRPGSTAREKERERERERERDMERERERQDALLSQQCARSF